MSGTGPARVDAYVTKTSRAMKVDSYVTLPHYAAHLAPIWWALPPDRRGRFYAAGLAADLGNGEGIAEWRIGHPPGAEPVTLVAGAADEQTIRRPTIYVEHGAGQAYGGDPAAAGHPAYSGTAGHDRTVLFVCPNETVAARWQARYPRTPVAVVGCPRLDGWHLRRPPTPFQDGGRPTLAVTFHANNVLCPETRTAWRHYQLGLPEAIRRLRADGWDVIGHGHPRLWATIRPWWEKIGVEPVGSLDEVFERADVLAVDNSSAGPEFASLGRPIIWMNAPWYRRDVSHGGRFWTWTEGVPTVDGPEELADTAATALSYPPAMRRAHERMVAGCYAYTDGRAAARAAAAICGLDATRVYTPTHGAAPVRPDGQRTVSELPGRPTP